jgi:hypothetical protein
LQSGWSAAKSLRRGESAPAEPPTPTMTTLGSGAPSGVSGSEGSRPAGTREPGGARAAFLFVTDAC